MPLIRLIACDLDGTLLRNDGTISDRTRDAIISAQRAGLVFAAVTARAPRYIESLMVASGVAGLAVCSNGAILYDMSARAVLHCSVLRNETARELVQSLRSAIPGLVFAVEHKERVMAEMRFPALAEETSSRLRAINTYLDEDPVKLLVHHPEHGVDRLASLVASTVGDVGEVSHSGGRMFVEVGAHRVSKATGLALLCDHLRIDSKEVIAFGDMPNDVPMLRYAGHSVAVANAHQDVLAIADEVVASNQEDGVAQRIEQLLG